MFLRCFILDEMKKYEVKPMVQTYVCLLNACATAGRIDRAYAIICDMTTAGLGLNKFCYAGLIAALKNKSPIIKFIERSIEWTSVEASSASVENLMMGVAEEELYNLPTAEYVHRHGGFLNRQLTVYHVAFHACADLGNVETGGYTTANYIWDLTQARKITSSLPAVEAYYNGLKGREILEDDPWLLQVS
ncbi:hypothetical protein FEM48_Zijuj07G0083200 [Ziziphus jujuba var. spinosa]|uniref:Pentatricopeptide repeat-containing protein n=1 Tax=Ziziphus jujuba var. spinosa TaxID=714518 RepID=A0A978V3I8_ZIZJJ|nr:hypothetical protein FEM48_Zijuj07G0083200 [Ziziphus jujuba var. spinosa]